MQARKSIIIIIKFVNERGDEGQGIAIELAGG